MRISARRQGQDKKDKEKPMEQKTTEIITSMTRNAGRKMIERAEKRGGSK